MNIRVALSPKNECGQWILGNTWSEKTWTMDNKPARAMTSSPLTFWDPDTKQVQELTPTPPRQTKPAPSSLKWVNTSSHAFGFDIAIDQNFENIRLEQLPPGLPATHQLYVVRNGSSAPEAVSLRFPRLPKGLPPAYHRIDPNREWPDVYGPAFAGPTSLLVPYDSKRAFHVVPYADIQQWLATNAPPVATTNVSTTSNPSTTQGR